MGVIARLPACDGQAADAVSAYTQLKLEDAPRQLNISKSVCPDVRIRLPRHKWPNSWSNIEDLVVPLERHLSTSGRVLCIFGSRTFVPISWMCKKQTSVSHRSTESEIISLDAGLRMDGLLALYLWDMVIEVLRSTNNTARHG